MGFFHDKSLTQVDINEFEKIKQEVLTAETNVEASVVTNTQLASQVATDKVDVETAKGEVQQTNTNLAVKFTEMDALASTLSDTVNEVKDIKGDTESAVSTVQAVQKDVDQMHTSILDNKAVIAQYVVDVDNDRIDAEAARDAAIKSAKDVDNAVASALAASAQAQETANDALVVADKAAIELQKVQEEVTKIDAVLVEAVDAKDEAVTRADEAMTYATTSKQHSDASAASALEAKGYRDGTLTAASQVTQAAQEAKADANRAEAAAVTSTSEAAVATSEADRAQQIADSLQSISDGSFGVTSVNSKVGIVTLSSSDIGAVDKTGDAMSGDLTFPQGNGVSLGGWKQVATSGGDLSTTVGGDEKLVLTNDGDLKPVGKVYDSSHRVYSPANKPSPADIGALDSSYQPSWSSITGAPNVFPSTWGGIDGKPETATRWPTANEVGALPKLGTAVNSEKVQNMDVAGITSAARVGLVPDTRTVNGKALSSDVTISKVDVGLENVPNYTISDSVDDNDTGKFASASAVYQAARRGPSIPSGYNAVNTYIFARASSPVGPGGTISGSSLFASDSGGNFGSALSGTWRAMGQRSSNATATLFLRIS